MSEEPEVSPLRLKRPGAGGPPTPPQAPETPPAAAPAPPVPLVPEPPLVPVPGMPMPPLAPADQETAPPERLRRRPSLSSDDPAPPPAAGHPDGGAGKPDLPPAPAAPPVFKLKVGIKPPGPPPPLAPVGPEAAADPGRMIEPAGPGEAPLLPLPGFGPAGVSKEAPLVPLPVPPQAVGAVGGVPGVVGLPPPRGPIHLRAEAPAEALAPSKLPPPLPAHAAKAALARHRPRRDALFFGLLFLLLLAGGGGAYFYFAKPEVANEVAGTAREKLSQAAQLPGEAVEEAKQSLAGARDKEQARLDSILEGKDVPAERALGNVTPVEMEAKLRERNNGPTVSSAPSGAGAGEAASSADATPVVAYAGEKAAEEASAAPQAVQPGARFLRYAEGIRVSGVFQGTPARALVDGRLVRQGELLEPTLGIKFAEVDAQAKQLVLEDASGARVRVRY